jgi:hypothetical protein
MGNLEKININIWDDFYDDGYIPEGKKQESYIYVEEYDNGITEEKKKECLEVLLRYINENLNVSGVKIWMKYYDSRIKYPKINEIDNPQFMKEHPNFHFCRWEIRIEDLTHERLDEWMEKLEDVSLSVDGIPFNIYSES